MRKPGELNRQKAPPAMNSVYTKSDRSRILSNLCVEHVCLWTICLPFLNVWTSCRSQLKQLMQKMWKARRAHNLFIARCSRNFKGRYRVHPEFKGPNQKVNIMRSHQLISTATMAILLDWGLILGMPWIAFIFKLDMQIAFAWCRAMGSTHFFAYRRSSRRWKRQSQDLQTCRGTAMPCYAYRLSIISLQGPSLCAPQSVAKQSWSDVCLIPSWTAGSSTFIPWKRDKRLQSRGISWSHIVNNHTYLNSKIFHDCQ